jgi:NAD(P)-dependent dehydrogenase (short-subunit alcohol dehydrogenase family)
MGQLDGRVALVTGGGRGIGRGISELLASEGAAVAVNYRRDQEAADATVAAIEAAGGVARAYQASVDDAEQDARMVDAVLADLGAIDLLVNNGGVASRGNAVADTDPAEVARVLGTHAVGPHHLCRLVLPSMRTRPRGDIVMVSSVATAHHAGKGAPYNMGKAAPRPSPSRWPRRAPARHPTSTWSRPAWSTRTWGSGWPRPRPG